MNNLEDYFNELKMRGIDLSDAQMAWYRMKSNQLGNSTKQEYPSTPEEAFETANEGLYYGAQIAKLRIDGHICKVPYQDSSPVHVAFDIGYDDHTAIWFFQLMPGNVVHLIDYYENCNEGATFYCNYMKSKGYNYGSVILPHDAESKNAATATSWKDVFQNLMSSVDIVVLPARGEGSVDVFNGIQAVRSTLGRCYFDEFKCKTGLHHLEAYKKEWNDKIGGFRDAPLHDSASHCSDCFRYLCVGLDRIGGKRMTPEKIKELRRNAGYK